MFKLIRNILKVGICVVIFIAACSFGINFYVLSRSKDNIIDVEKINEIGKADCIVVLGCGLIADGVPSNMLADRLNRGVELYNKGVAPKIIMSGDHGGSDYDEVNVMKQFAIDAGVLSEDIFMDHAGFSTYDSIYRANKIFGAKKIVIVSQEYHLYRAVYTAKALGMEAYGVGSDYRTYVGQAYRDAREVLARTKDFVMCLFKPEPKYLGDLISLSGSGDATNDK